MIYSTTAAYAIFPVETCIDEIAESLSNAGCRHEDVCLLLTPTHEASLAVRDAKVANRALCTNAPTSQLDLLRGFSRFGAVIIPGVAFFVSSRVFLRSVLTPCLATEASAYADRLIGLGLPRHEAERYGERLSRDAIVLFVCCSGAARAHWIREVLWSSGAEEASCLQDATGGAYSLAQEHAPQMAT